MELKENEYIIVRNNGEDGIYISKETLEKWRKKYNDISRNGADMSVGMYYGGRADLLSEILLHFRYKQEIEK